MPPRAGAGVSWDTGGLGALDVDHRTAQAGRRRPSQMVTWTEGGQGSGPYLVWSSWPGAEGPRAPVIRP